MISSLNSGISAMQQFQQKLDVIGNNIANVNTTGFKAGRVEFADAFSQTLRPSSQGSANTTATTAMQVGSGVTTTAVRNLYTPGALAQTTVQTDMAIQGEGFFTVRDPLTDKQFVTRAGEFRVDQKGYLVTNDGKRLQGYSDAGLGTLGDLQIDGTGRPATASATAAVSAFAIDQEGKINIKLSDGSEFVRGQVLLQTFSDPQALTKEGNSLYSGMGNAGPGTKPFGPGTNGTGVVRAGYLESSNVDLALEFTDLITTQRGFQANARIISTSDEFMQELVNLKR